MQGCNIEMVLLSASFEFGLLPSATDHAACFGGGFKGNGGAWRKAGCLDVRIYDFSSLNH